MIGTLPIITILGYDINSCLSNVGKYATCKV